MNMKRVLLFCTLFVVVSTAYSQAIKIIGIFDTTDSSIGTSMTRERMIVINELKNIANSLELYGYDMQVEEYYGANCGKQPLMQAINNLQVSNEDIVIFYYAGHGARSVNDKVDKFPQMCLGERNPDNYVPASLVRNMIAKKNPKFALILTGCCNSNANITIKSIVAMSSGYTNQQSINPEFYHKLFCEQSGIVQLTSSKAGEYSFCGESGSLFANVLIDVMNDVGTGQFDANWSSICNEISSICSSVDIEVKGVHYRQHPDYSIFPAGASGNSSNGKSVVNKNPLERDLAKLLDKSVPVNQRLSDIQQIRTTHFSGNVMVMTMGRDMQTIVDYEDPDTFLRRITMSPYITHINVVDRNENYVTVHEVRSR